MTRLLEQAKALGFDTAVPLDPIILETREDVRAMCAADKCGVFGKNWGCPPHCGSVAQCQQTLHSYKRGILLQTVGHMRKAIDSKCYRDTEQRHLAQFHAFTDIVRKEYPEALCLGTGGCQVPYHHGEKTITYTACVLF